MGLRVHIGSQKRHCDSKKKKPLQVRSNVKVIVTFVIVKVFAMNFTSWLDCQHRVLSWSDEMSARCSENKKARFVEGEKNGFTMTRLPHIPQCLFVTLSQSTRPIHPTAFVLTGSRTSRLLFVHHSEFRAGWSTLEYPRKFAGGAACYSTKNIPAMLPKLAKMLDAVY